MNGFLEKLVTRRLVAFLGMASILLIGGGWLWAWLALGDLPYSLVLHWNNLVHVNQVGDVYDLNGIGIFALLVALMNSLIAVELDARDWFLGKFLACGTLAFALLIFIGFTAIISVN